MAKEKEKKQKNTKPEVLDEAGKKKALESAISQIEKDFGEGTIMRMGSAAMDVKTVPSGSLTLDLALGVGGIPRGRIIEIFGPESSGKTTVALHMVAEVQKTGGEAAYIDAEHALDPIYAKNIGVDINNLLVSQPGSGEDALEIAEKLVYSGAIDVIVVDSVAALVTQAEIDGDMGSSHVGQQARLMSQAMRKLAGIVAKSNCILIFINQLREKIGVMYGSPETTTGGRALKFYASVRIDIRKADIIKVGTELVGSRVKCKVVKNKVAAPFKTAEFDIIYGKGISKTGEVVDVGAELGIIKKSGSWFSYEGERIGQGRENVKAYLEGNPEMLAVIEKAIKEKMSDKSLIGEQSFGGGDEDDEFDIKLLESDEDIE